MTTLFHKSVLLSLSLAVISASLSASPALAKDTSPVPGPVAAVSSGTTTPIPAVQGPLKSTAETYPFGAADHQEVPQDLTKLGYVEEEYLVSGTSNVYTWPTTGPAQIRTADAPYTTRVLVRKPAKDQKFSGNVIVEMLNPSNLFDLNIGWAMTQEQIVANGDAWVGITAKPIAVQALKNFDPERYASLSFANPLPLTDPRNCTAVASDSSRTTENGLIWDIYSQVGAWLKSDAADNPLRYDSPTTRVEHAYGFGYSQTGGFLVNYINGVHPLVGKADGAPIYDAYIVAVAGGAFAGAYPMNQCEAAPPATDARRQFKDVGVPIMRMMSQSDYLRGIGSRRADSDAPGDQYRHYEMAGAGHATPDELIFSASSEDIIAADRAVPPVSCNEGPRSRFPSSIFFNAALRNLDLWVRDGIAPPRAEPILVRDGAPVLDEFGNVQGGLRSPFLDAPTSTWYGTATGASFCFIAGYERPLPQNIIDGLYKNHGSYVKAVKNSVQALERQGFLTDYDARDLQQDAARSDIP
ncbi:alpha/beta hydrolase domain-containing protein [Arthrobacter sp. TmT3-37]